MDSSRDEVYSRRVRAGKRTYYIDVRSTRSGNDFYLTITESKRGGEDEREKFKIFLYKEDFEKFREAFNQALDFVYGELGKINALPRAHVRDDYQRDEPVRNDHDRAASMGGDHSRPRDDSDRGTSRDGDHNASRDENRGPSMGGEHDRGNNDRAGSENDSGVIREERGRSDDYSRDYGSHGYETRED